jgi:hypothetical protein
LFDELLQLDGVLGVVRYDAMPFFGTTSQHTFVYTHGAVIASCFVRGHGLWDWVPIEPSGIIHADLLERVVPWLSFQVIRFQHLGASHYGVEGKCPAQISRWDQVCLLAQQAPSCFPPIPDGVSYRHGVYGRETTILAHWSNPEPKEHPSQCALIDAYSRLLASANLTPFLVQEAFGLNKKAEPPVVEHDDEEQESEIAAAGKKRRKPWQRRR